MTTKPGNSPFDNGDSSRSRALTRMAQVLSLALVFPLAVFVGLRLGGWLGGLGGWPTLGAVLGATLGVVAGFLELLRRLESSRDDG